MAISSHYQLLSLMAMLISYAQAGEIISDIADQVATSPEDERKALEIKSEQFWSAIYYTAKDMKMDEHVELYADAEAVLGKLGEEHSFVHEALSEALRRLKNADEQVLLQGARSSQVAADALAKPVTRTDLFSFMRGVNTFRQAIRRFVNGGQYSEHLVQHIQERRECILPALEGAASITGNVLSDCRLSSKRSFDVLKYDIYNKGVPRTPQEVKDIANRIVDASSQTRRRFTSFITEAATSIARDVQQQHESAVVTITRARTHGEVTTNKANWV